MERRAASHTEEEEMNQRRRLLGLARKGDPKAISKLFELYQVRVLNGDMLSKLNKSYYKAAAAQEQKAAQAPAKTAKGSQAAHGSVKGSQKAAAPAARKSCVSCFLPDGALRDGRGKRECRDPELRMRRLVWRERRQFQAMVAMADCMEFTLNHWHSSVAKHPTR